MGKIRRLFRYWWGLPWLTIRPDTPVENPWPRRYLALKVTAWHICWVTPHWSAIATSLMLGHYSRRWSRKWPWELTSARSHWGHSRICRCSCFVARYVPPRLINLIDKAEMLLFIFLLRYRLKTVIVLYIIIVQPEGGERNDTLTILLHFSASILTGNCLPLPGPQFSWLAGLSGLTRSDMTSKIYAAVDLLRQYQVIEWITLLHWRLDSLVHFSSWTNYSCFYYFIFSFALW